MKEFHTYGAIWRYPVKMTRKKHREYLLFRCPRNSCRWSERSDASPKCNTCMLPLGHRRCDWLTLGEFPSSSAAVQNGETLISACVSWFKSYCRGGRFTSSVWRVCRLTSAVFDSFYCTVSVLLFPTGSSVFGFLVSTELCSRMPRLYTFLRHSTSRPIAVVLSFASYLCIALHHSYFSRSTGRTIIELLVSITLTEYLDILPIH